MLQRSSRLICALQLCCALLLALAQHTALTHAIWHAAGAEEHAEGHAHSGHERHGDHAHHAHHGHHGDHEDDPQRELCAYHAALGQVLGADCADVALAYCAACVSDVPSGASRERIAAEAIRPVSRGPPRLL